MSRSYSAISTEMHLTNSINDVVGSAVLDTLVGLPAVVPYTLVLGVGETNEEVVTVTAVAGYTVTITRGEDGTTASEHTTSEKVRHLMTARDLRDAAEHHDATQGVHGIGPTSEVVGTDDVQVLTNKDLDGSENDFSNIPQAAVTNLVSALTTLTTAVATEATARASADTTETTARALADTTEATTRGAADTALGARVTVLEDLRDDYLSDSDTVQRAAAGTGQDLVYADAEISLTAGTWIVEGGASVATSDVLDTVGVGLYNQTDTANVADSLGVPGLVSAGGPRLPLHTRPTVITVASTKAVRLYVDPNGASTVVVGGAHASAPAVWLFARRV